MNKQKIKLGLRVMWFGLKERAYDALNVTLPIFIVTGILVACVRFWMWVFFG